jgi:2-methylcitrate dehydratase PrpD
MTATLPDRQRTGEPALSSVVARFVTGLTLDDVPAEVVATARRLVLDAVGIGAASTGQEFGRRLAAIPWPAPAGGGATALGIGSACTAEDAALVNGVLAHGLDFDDTYQPGIVHIGAVVVPTALAVGQSLGRDSDEIVAAVIAGYEVSSRLGEASPGAFHAVGYHATPICGAFAAAAVAAKLFGADEAGCAAALGIAGSFAAGIQEFLRDGSDTKRLHPGWAATSGIRAARFALAGFGGPHRVWEGEFGLFATHVGLDGFHGERVTDGLGERWNILRMSVKPYPCCHLLHAHIDAARELRARGVRPGDITRVRALIHRPGLSLLAEPEAEKRRPSTTYGAQFSLPFAVAAGFLDEHVRLDSFAADRLADPEIRRLSDLVECVEDTESRHPEHFDGAVEVWLADGTRHAWREEVNRGSPSRRLTVDELTAKFTGNLVAAGIDQETAGTLATRFLDGDDVIAALDAVNSALVR